MAHLEISTITENPFHNAYSQKYTPEEYIHQGYHNSEDDNSTVVSPTTTWRSSRRSSYSSLSSSNTATAEKSINCSDKNVLYPTKQAAYERIDYLEEQMRLHKESNEAIVKNMMHSIDSFLQQRQTHPVNESSNTQVLVSEGLGSSTQAVVVDKLLQLVSQYLSKAGDETTLTTQIIENWIHSVTDHKQSTKQDLKNVLIPLLFATEKERQRNTRLVQALQRLTRQKHTACQTAKQTKKFHSIRMQSLHQAQIQKLKQQWQAKIDAAVEEQQEMEQVLDDMRREMETMLEELDQVKQQKERYQQKAKRLEQDLIQSTTNSDEDAVLQNLLREAETRIDQLQADLEDQIIKTSKLKQSSAKDMETIKSRMSTLHSQQVSALIAEKEELRSRLVKAERSAAELALLFEVEKKKTAVKPHDSELEHALRRTVAEKDGELAKARFELEKMQKHMEHLQTFSEKQMQRELEARMEELESNLRSEHQKRFDANQVHLTRELRELAGQIVELEAELQGLERQHEQDMRLVESTKKSQWSAQEKLSQKKKEWDTRETELKMSIVKADQKIISLEKEALVLYGKNLEMAQHLGELDP